MLNMTHRNRYLYPIEAFSKVIDITSEDYGAVGSYDAGDDAIIAQALSDASNVSAAQTVYIPQGQWLIQNTMELIGVHVIAAPGAIFKPSAVDVDMVKMGAVSSWTGGHFRLNDIAWVGKCFFIDGTLDMGGLTSEIKKAPRISFVDMIAAGEAGSKAFYLHSPWYQDTPPVASQFGVVGRVMIDNIRMRAFGTGLHLFSESDGYTNNNYFSNIEIHSPIIAIHLENAGVGVNANLFNNICIQASTTPQTTQCIIIEGSYNQINGLMIWDLSTHAPNQFALDVSGSYNIVSGYGYTGHCRDTGIGNMITGVSSRVWSGANLVNEQKVYLEPGEVEIDESYLSDAITFGGATLGDYVLVGPPESLAGIVHCGMVTAANTVKIRMENRTAAAKTFTTGLAYKWNVRVVSKNIYTLKSTWDLSAEIANEGFVAKDFTVTGCVRGSDFVLVSLEIDASQLFQTATITADGTVTVTLHNFTGAGVTLPSASAVPVRIKILKNRGDFYAAVNPPSLATGATSAQDVTYTGATLQGIVLFSPNLDISDMCMSAQATVNKLYVNMANHSLTNPLDLGSTTWAWRYLPYGQPLE